MENTSVFFNDQAWKGLGSSVSGALTTSEAIVAAGCDWYVEKRNNWYEHNGAVHKSKKYSIVRDTDGVELGTVGKNTEPLQNVNAFRFFDPIVEAGLVTLEAAGSLQGGSRIWVLAKVSGVSAEIVPGDSVDQFLLLAHAHDGTLSIQAGFTEWRRRCSNYLQTALKSGRLFKFKHTKTALIKLEEARKSFDFAHAQLNRNSETYKFLAQTNCNDATFRKYLHEVFTPGGSENSESNKTIVNKVFPLFTNGRGAETSRGTFWGAYNAITEYNTHERGRSADARVDNVWFGKTAAENVRALEVAIAMAKKV